MHFSFLSALPFALSMSLGIAVATAPAHAITCDGNFQIVQGQPISTPYCRDQNLAIVAREYGVKTSPASIRNHPAHKEEVCRIVGRDIRVQEACIDVLPEGRSRR